MRKMAAAFKERRLAREKSLVGNELRVAEIVAGKKVEREVAVMSKAA
jgi:hypothetical protein